jgi:hypothetical protein
MFPALGALHAVPMIRRSVSASTGLSRKARTE